MTSTTAAGPAEERRPQLEPRLRAQLERTFTHRMSAEQIAQALTEIARDNPELFKEMAQAGRRAAGQPIDGHAGPSRTDADHPGRPLRPFAGLAQLHAPDTGADGHQQPPAGQDSASDTQDTQDAGSGPDDAGSGPTGPIQNWTIDAEHRAGLLRRIESAGSLEEAVQRLWTDNADARRQARQARDDANAANAEARNLRRQLEQSTPEGSIQLTAEEAAAWEAYKALGEPATLQTTIDAASEASAELARLQRQDLIRKSAELAGFSAGILADLDRANPGLHFEIAEAEDGSRQAMIKPGEEADPVPLAQYAETAWAQYLPVLRPAQGSGPAPLQYPRQRPAGDRPADAASALVRRMLEEQNERRPSALQAATRPDAGQQQAGPHNPLRSTNNA